MNRIKFLFFNLLCNPVMGSIIQSTFGDSVPDIRWKGFRFFIDKHRVAKRFTASIFWGFYESSEIRFVEKFLDKDRDVLELGSSIGVVSSHIAAKLNKSSRLVCIEANPQLLDSINTNITRHIAKDASFQVINCAISYDVEKVHFASTSNNTDTRVKKNKSSTSSDEIVVDARTLSSILKETDLGEYTLVSDIEGSEVEIFMNETDCLQKCRQLFIELHDTSYRDQSYTPQGVAELIQSRHGFKLVSQHGPVYYFNRKSG